MARMLVVGFDGATLELCERWIADGRMPVLAGLMADGSFGPMRSTLPSNSAVAWTTLATGTSPGRHGVFDFVLPRSGAYGYRVATRADRRVPAFWNLASSAGARVAVVNIPMTFPAEPVNGVMVSGMDAPRLDERAVHPSEHLVEIRSAHPGYRIISNAHHAASSGDFDAAERELIDVVVARAGYTCAIGRARDLDLVMVNLEATDGAHHFFWQHHDPEHPRHDPVAAARWGDTIGRVYETTDRELGRLIEAHAPDTVLVVSDHGGGPSSDQVLFLNDWLASEGLLHIRPSAGRSLGRRAYGEAVRRLPVPVRRRLRALAGPLDRAKGAALYGDVDWASTNAYALQEPAVRLNLLGREPSGAVPPERREEVVARIVERAAALRLPDGSPAFPHAAPASEVYRGDAPGGPDVVLEPAPGLQVRSRRTAGSGPPIAELSDLGTYLPSGVHTPVGMVVAAGAGIAELGRVEDADIHQVAASVLRIMGIPAEGLDGDPLPFVEGDAPRAPDVSAGTRATAPEDATTAPAELDETEEAEVLDRLRGLGYVD